MEDEYLYETAPDGRQFRACIFESKHVPLGCVRYQIDANIPELHWWYKVEETFEALVWDDATIAFVKERLQWWAQNYLDMPVAKQFES